MRSTANAIRYWHSADFDTRHAQEEPVRSDPGGPFPLRTRAHSTEPRLAQSASTLPRHYRRDSQHASLRRSTPEARLVIHQNCIVFFFFFFWQSRIHLSRQRCVLVVHFRLERCCIARELPRYRSRGRRLVPPRRLPVLVPPRTCSPRIVARASSRIPRKPRGNFGVSDPCTRKRTPGARIGDERIIERKCSAYGSSLPTASNSRRLGDPCRSAP